MDWQYLQSTSYMQSPSAYSYTLFSILKALRNTIHEIQIRGWSSSAHRTLIFQYFPVLKL